MSAFFQAIKKFFQAICLRLQVTGENLQELSVMFTQSRTAFMVKHFPHWKKKTILFGIPVKKTKPWQSFSDFFEKDRWNQLLGQICIMGFVVWIIISGNLISNPQNFEFFSQLGSLIFSFLILYGLMLCMMYLFGSAFVPALILGLVGFFFPAIDYFKYQLQQLHFFPWDLLLVSNAGSFTDFMPQIVLPHALFEYAFVSILWVVFFYFAQIRPPFFRTLGKRLAACVVSFFIINACLSGSLIHEAFCSFCGLDLENITDQDNNFAQNGFITAFLLNFGYLNTSEPQNYSLHTMEESFEPYLADGTVPEDWVNPDVIIILSESYWDPTVLNGVEFSEDPLKYYREIAAENPSGTMISPSFGGGTCRPEFEVMTGMSTNPLPEGASPHKQYIFDKTYSYAWYFREMGYDTVGIHTYEKTFYDRDRVYPLLGIDDFRGNYDLHVPYKWNSYWYITDETLADEVIYELNQAHETGLFLLGITMENHGLYYEKFKDYDWDIKVSGDALTEEDIVTLQNFCKGVKDSDAALKQIYDAVMAREKPTVVLWFGDHLPTLGDNYDIYTKTGTIQHADSAQWTEEEKYTMTSVPYVIFANYDTGNDYEAEGKCVSPYLLTPLMLDYVNAPRTLQTNFLMDVYEKCPVINTAFNLYSEGVSENEREEIERLHWLLTYDQMIGSRYIQQIVEEHKNQ